METNHSKVWNIKSTIPTIAWHSKFGQSFVEFYVFACQSNIQLEVLIISNPKI